MSKNLLVLTLGIFFCAQTYAARTISKRLHPAHDKVDVYMEGFTAAEENTIERALDFLSYRLSDIRRENLRSTSKYELCVAKYSTKDWREWNAKLSEMQNKGNNAYWTYNDVRLALLDHAQTGLEIKIKAIYEENKVWGRAVVGHYPKASIVPDLVIKLNRYNLAKNLKRDDAWGGTIFHEFLHRVGYSHPTGYPGSLIKEAGLCITRKFAMKPASKSILGTGIARPALLDDPMYEIED